jgi:hypothetical protein
MKIGISIPDDIIIRTREYNKTHLDRPINVSAVCRLAIEKALTKALEQD